MMMWALMIEVIKEVGQRPVKHMVVDQRAMMTVGQKAMIIVMIPMMMEVRHVAL